jgi:ubiquitin C-terminal hydrolase
MEYQRYLEILKDWRIGFAIHKKKVTYLVSCSWFNNWLDYVSGDSSNPGPIDNRSLWHLIYNKLEVVHKKDYFVLDEKVWEYLHEIYQGGPILHKHKKQVNLDTVSMRSSTTSFEGASVWNMISDNVSQSDIGGVAVKSSWQLVPNWKEQKSFYSKNSSFVSNNDDTVSNSESRNEVLLKTQTGFKHTYFNKCIAEMPHEEEKYKNDSFETESKKHDDLIDDEDCEDFNEENDDGELEDEEEEDEEEYEEAESRQTGSNWEFNIIGLKNPGNFWYMNVWLQALLSINELVEYYLKIHPNDLLSLAKSSKKKQNISYLFTLFCHEALIEDREDAYNPVMLQNITKKIFSTQMQDTHEFFLYFFSKLQEEENNFKKSLRVAKGMDIPKEPTTSIEKSADIYWKKYKDSHSSIIDRLFTGLQSTSVVRKWCGKISKNYEPFLDISLEINNKSVGGWMRDYFLDEKIGIESKYFCEHWKRTTKAIIRKRIEKAPNNLIIHLKRFAYPTLKKDRTLISYKHALDIEPFMSSEKPTNQDPDSFTKYELFGMIIHKGREMDRGHYICLFKREDKWYEFDDDKVYEIQGKEFTKYVLDKEIYILFYKKAL